MNFFSSLFSKPNVDINIDEVPKRRSVYLRDEDYNRIILPSFYDKEDVSGDVTISLNNKAFEHKGIKILLLGIIEGINNSKKTTNFISLAKDLSPPGTLVNQVNTFKFIFKNVEKQYESYRGVEFNVKYILRVIINSTIRNLTYEREFGVVCPEKKEVLNVLNDPIKMDVGIGELLKLSFELDRTKYSTKDVITGRIIFRKVQMGLKVLFVQIMRREAIFNGETDHAILCKFELMDGAPIKDEIVPIRFFIAPYELTPTYSNVNNIFSVRYYLNFVLIDDKNKRYFKQHEIVLYRIPRIPIKLKVNEESKKEKISLFDM